MILYGALTWSNKGEKREMFAREWGKQYDKKRKIDRFVDFRRK